MALKGESLRELGHLQRRINLMFQEMLQPEVGHAALPTYTWAPATDVSEDEGHYFVDVELPGVPLTDISVTCHGTALKVSGERRPSRELSPQSVQRVERYFGPFLREISFPGPVVAGKVEASLSDGLLSLTVPKKPAGHRRIPVR